MTDKTLILVVDDNVINRRYFSMSLKKSGFAVITVESGEIALEQASIIKFDVILMDIRMPEMDGYECTRRIKQIKLQEKTPIYAVSAEELFKDQYSLFSGFLLKPISPKALDNIINKHCRNKLVAFNKKSALKFAYNDNIIVKTLSNLFIKEFPLQINALRQLITNEEVQNSADLMHKIKGSCKACGAQKIEKIISEFSTLLNKRKFSQLLARITELEEALYYYKKSTKSLLLK